MHIWVDADACPVVVKEILFRAAQRTGLMLTLVANRPINIPRAPNIKMRCVAAGFDVADQAIVNSLAAGDLVISSDIPLAADVLAKGGHVLSPRGEQLTADNIRERLTVRDFLETLRGSGIQTGGPPAFSQSDRKAFADQLDRFLARRGG